MTAGCCSLATNSFAQSEMVADDPGSVGGLAVGGLAVGGLAVGGLGSFADALSDAGVRVLGRISSAALARQKALFGDGQGFLPFVEDDNSDLHWEFPDGTRLDGFQTLAALSQTSGIPLPTDVISIQTNIGRLEWQLLVSEASDTVENFLRYVNGGVDGEGYTGTIVHRVEPNFVVQGGGFRPTSLTTTDIDEIRGDYVPALGRYEHHIPSFTPIPDERARKQVQCFRYVRDGQELGRSHERVFFQPW